MESRTRRIFSLAVAGASVMAFPAGVLRAAPPEVVRYQARLTDAAGVPLGGAVTLSFAIYAQASGGTALWSEVHALGLEAGALDVLLGQTLPLASAVVNAPERWLEIAVDDGSGAKVLQPRQRLASVPFALVTDRLGTKTLTEVEADVDSRIAAHSAASDPHAVYVKKTGDTMSGVLSLSGPLSALEVQSSADTPLRVTSSDVDANFIFEGAGSSRILASRDSPNKVLELLVTSTGLTSASVTIEGKNANLTGLGAGSVLLASARESTTGDIQLVTQGLERMIVTQDGDVGIGTLSPMARLHVAGNVRATAFIGDGSQLTGIGGPPCPTDMVSAGSYCIDRDQNPALNWYDAVIQCQQESKRLCLRSEWYGACTAGISGLNGMTGDSEWAGELGSPSNDCVAFGGSVCKSLTGSNCDTTQMPFRCCR